MVVFVLHLFQTRYLLQLNGTCVNGDCYGNGQCYCGEVFTGRSCETCLCQDGGTCTNTSCICLPGYTGKFSFIVFRIRLTL